MASRTVRIFLIYAEEDYQFRDLLVRRARSSQSEVEFADMPTKQPWVERWKAACRTRAYECDGAIVLVTKRTKQGAGVKWELECVLNSGIPILGIYAEKCERSSVPDELRDERFIEWDLPEITKFIQSLQKPTRQNAARGGPGS